ncbi:hypothetical protein ANO11243_062070 [Dothideomycetidae sp. 11243]|nr:hypothetical protein ANO11243_062070 [fungal sp. No.11243]
MQCAQLRKRAAEPFCLCPLFPSHFTAKGRSVAAELRGLGCPGSVRDPIIPRQTPRRLPNSAQRLPLHQVPANHSAPEPDAISIRHDNNEDERQYRDQHHMARARPIHPCALAPASLTWGTFRDPTLLHVVDGFFQEAAQSHGRIFAAGPFHGRSTLAERSTASIKLCQRCVLGPNCDPRQPYSDRVRSIAFYLSVQYDLIAIICGSGDGTPLTLFVCESLHIPSSRSC